MPYLGPPYSTLEITLTALAFLICLVMLHYYVQQR